MSKSLVIVESPTKANTLRKFLGDGYLVEATVGHIRDLPENAAQIPAAHKKKKWARLGVDVENDFEPLYVVQPDKKKTITALKKLLKECDELLLATDEDREGEAISWHVLELLKPKVPVKRMVFHEITKTAVQHALANTREVDTHLVEAQEARRIIDRLYGYEVSPILWRKIAKGLSAGRVQSVAVRMVVEREQARMRFHRASYWDLVATFQTPAGGKFDARLHELEGRRIASGKDFDPDSGTLKKASLAHLDEAAANDLRDALAAGAFSVSEADEKPFTRSPAPPFTTSTLQQEANRKLRFDARRTMRAAQKLYESGLITYMRTDSVALSNDAIAMTRKNIEQQYGPELLPPSPRRYKNKVKNAQEAHECIRPAGDRIRSVDEVRKLGSDEAKLYELIWKRTMACQMTDARGRRMSLKVSGSAAGRSALFQARGSVVDKPGFLRAYVEGSDDPDAVLADKDTLLPPVEEGQTLTCDQLVSDGHETTPPPRLTEAALIKALEESGIGRPSTYASIIDTIQRRDYTFKKGNALVPSFVAFAVVALMREHLTDLIDPTFTARMEDRLDAISRGEQGTLPYLKEFYFGNGTLGLRPLLDQKAADIDPRTVCTISIGTDADGNDVAVRVGRYGPYLQRGEDTAPLPEGLCPDEVDLARAEILFAEVKRADTPIGHHPENGKPIYVKSGRYGPYVQLGESQARPAKKSAKSTKSSAKGEAKSEDGEEPKKPAKSTKKTKAKSAAKAEVGEKPKMVSLLKGMIPAEMTFEVALSLLALPRPLGVDSEGRAIEAGVGRYGPFVKREREYRSLTADDNVLTVDLARALVLFAQEKRSGRAAPATLKLFENVKALGGKDIKMLDGRYGPYVTDGDFNASLPKDTADPQALTVEEALELLAVARTKKKKPRRRTKK